jgi:hypothetical protein
MKFVWCVVLAVLSGYCFGQKRGGRDLHSAPATNQEIQDADILRLVQSKIGPNPDKVPNGDKSFTLFKKDTLNTSSIPIQKYVVVRNLDGRVVMEGSVTMGLLDWTADYELTETRSLGSAQSSENQITRRIDLRPYLANIKN